MELQLSDFFLNVVEQAAISAARSIGNGDPEYSDYLAVQSMRNTMQCIPMRGTIVIGEGERDKAPMLYIGEQIGLGNNYQPIDIAVDPLEGTNLCATGNNNAVTVLAASEQGGLLHAPDLYMKKLCVGPLLKGKLNINASIVENINIIAHESHCSIKDVNIVVLDRSRHYQLIQTIMQTGAKVHLIQDGDLSAAICTSIESNTNIHAVMGIGGAPEGVLAAAALKCLGGEIQGQLITDTNTASIEQVEKMGLSFEKTYKTEDLAPGKQIIFTCCGVTNGDLLDKVNLIHNKVYTHSMILTYKTCRLRYVNTVHYNYQ